MPWFFAIPEFLKKRACRYLLQHYLGQYLEEQINLDDLTVDLYSGTGTITNVPLNAEAVNDALQANGAPVKVLSGYFGTVTVSVPWTALLKDSCKVEVSGLTLSVVPLVTGSPTEEILSMTDSLFFSMTSSRQMAEEVLKSSPSPGEEVVDNSPGFEGMEALARAIEMVLAKVQITLRDATVQVNCHSPGASIEHCLSVRVRGVTFFDEQCQRESSVDVEERDEPPRPAAMAVKVLTLTGLTVELDSRAVSAVDTREEADDLPTLQPQYFASDSSSSSPDNEQPPDPSPGTLVAMATGDVNIKVKICQSESLAGPKLEVEGVVGSLHVLLSPHQLQVLSEFASGIATTGGSNQTFEKVHPGQNRPIPKTDMGRVLEPQLTRHVREEREKKQAREDRLHADPWDASLTQHRSMLDSTHSSMDEFFSLGHLYSEGSQAGLKRSSRGGYSHDADESSTVMSEGSSISTKPRAPPSSFGPSHSPTSTLESIPLHEGFGLQQLSASPSAQTGFTRGAGRSQFSSSQRTRSGSSYGVSSPSLGVKGDRCDYPQDVCRYSLTISGVTVSLLESNCDYTYTASDKHLSSGPHSAVSGRNEQLSCLDEGGLDPLKYFEGVSSILTSGVNRRSMQSTRQDLEQLLPVDHLLLWLSTVRVSATTEGLQLGLDMSVASAELWEYLYRNEANLPHITRPLSVSPVIQLTEEPGRPCLRLKLSSSTDPPRKQHGPGCVSQGDQSSNCLEVSMTSATVSVDVTLLDRVQSLLVALQRPSPRATSLVEKTNQSLYMTTSNFYAIEVQRQAVFNQTVATESPETFQQSTIRANCDTLNISLKFPVPDLREEVRPPWYRPSLRSEALFVTLSGVGVATIVSPASSTGVSSLDVQFATAQVFLSSDGSSESRELFLTAGPSQYDAQPAVSPVAARLSVIIQDPSEAVLSQLTNPPPEQYNTLDDMELAPSSPTSPSPFSSRRAMFSTAKESEDEDAHSEQLVLPGNPQEMAAFEQHTCSLSQYTIRCTLHTVSIHLPSHTFLETLYNRFGTDLLLWQPASPQSETAKPMFLSCIDSIIQPAVSREERFRLCRSALREEESDGESSDEGTVGPTLSRPREGRGLSQFALSVHVERCRVSMLTQACPPHETEVEEDDTASVYHSLDSSVPLVDVTQTAPATPRVTEHGLAVMDVTDLKVFTVSGYYGDPSHSYFCAQIWQVSLSHLGSLEEAGYPSYSCLDGSSDPTVHSQLLPVVYKTPEGMRMEGGGNTATQGGGAGRVWREDHPMVAVAMEIRLDLGRNTKTNKCAVALNNTTIRHHVTKSEHNCFKQLSELFELSEEEVAGYDPPSFITELHVHLESCTVEYRPLFLPLQVALTTSSVNLSTSLVTGSPVLRVRVMVDGTHLLLSDKTADYLELSQDYVSVMDLDWLELTIRLCNNSLCDVDTAETPVFARLPEVTIECSSNVLHLRTCVDSCIALRDLLVYLASHGDLHPPEHHGQEIRPYSSLASELTSAPSSLSSASGSPPVTTVHHTGDVDTSIGDLITEAMEEDHHPSTRHLSQEAGHKRRDHTPSYGCQATKSTSKKKSVTSKLQFHQSSEKSLQICFSDSDDDEGGEVARDVLRGRVVGGGPRGEREDETEDGFCIIETPTSTSVAPGAQPVVKSLLEPGEQLEVIDNHFTIPDCKTDQLQRPKDFPEPTRQYTLKDISIVWHFYGGTDFSVPKSSSSSSPHSLSPTSSPKGPRRLSKDSIPLSSQLLGRRRSNSGGSGIAIKKPGSGWRGRGPGDWRLAGGPGRDHSLLMEIELDHLRVQHETYPGDSEQSTRLVVLVRDIEVRDRLAQSQINKFLYQYTTDATPRQSHANMVSLKVLFTRPEVLTRPDIEEASVRLSVLPLRLNMDQDAVFFLLEFFKQVGDTSSIAATHTLPATASANVTNTSLEGAGPELTNSAQVFIRSFVFHPEVPIRIDYMRKGFHTETVGTLAGILLGLSHLDSSEVTLKALSYKNGMMGWEKVVSYAGEEWLSDIKTSQLPHILKGVGPMYHVSQLLQGVYDLFRLPYDQYMDDGRIMWGIQRGASSFTTSSGIAIVELTSRTLETVQWVAQMAYDLVTPAVQQGTNVDHAHNAQRLSHKAPHQPLDFREGVANAYDVVTAGIGGTARDLATVVAHEHEERGVTGAVGGVLRQIPGTIVKPIILASEATRHVLGGVKNQFVPDARREAQEKWRTSD